MTSNDIQVSHDMTEAQLMRVVMGDRGNTSEFASLRINYDDMSEDNKHEWPRGHFRIYDGEKTLFAPSVTLRVMLSRFQYSITDKDTHKIKERSVMFDSFFADIPDTMGTQKCGKLFKKEQEGLSDKAKEKQKIIKCTNVNFGIVSGVGVDEKGEPYEVSNVPCIFYAKGTNFTPMNDALTSLDKDNILPPTIDLQMTTERHRNDGVTYWSVIVERGDAHSIDNDTIDAIGRFGEYMHEQNDEVIEKYERVRDKKEAALRADASANVIDAVDSSDLDDDLPEVMVQN